MHVRVWGREASITALTVLRLGFGIGLDVSVWQHASPYVSVAWLTAILVSDLGDGVIARWLGVDTTRRRIIDVTIDRLSIHSAAAILVWRVPGAFWLMLPVVARDITLILYNWRLLVRKWTIITAGNIHRTGTFLYAVLYAVLLFTTGVVAQWAAVVIAVAVWFLLLDYLYAGLLVPVQPRDQPLARYQAVGLRALRGIVPPRRNAIGE